MSNAHTGGKAMEMAVMSGGRKKSLFSKCSAGGSMYDDRRNVPERNASGNPTGRYSCHVCGKFLRLRPCGINDGFQIPSHNRA
jgi:hypothetical protein